MDNEQIANSAASLSNSLNALSATVENKKSRKESQRYNEWYYENIYKPSAKWQLEEITKPYYGFQQDKQIEMIGRSLRANMDALRDNGINPLMLNGGLELPNSVGGTEDSLYTAPTNADIGSVMSGIGSLSSGTAASGLMLSQMAKNFADTKKVQSETKAQDTFNQFARELYSGQAKTANENYLNVAADTVWKKQDVERIRSEMNVLDVTVEKYNTEMGQMREYINYLVSLERVNEKQLDVMCKDIALKVSQSLYYRYGAKLENQQISALGEQVKLWIREGSQYAPYEYVERELLSGNKIIQDGILGNYKAQFYLGEDSQWHYGIESGDLDFLNEKTSGRSGRISKGLQFTKGMLDIFGTSVKDVFSFKPWSKIDYERGRAANGLKTINQLSK